MTYGRISRLMHWAMAFLVISAIALVEIKSLLPKGALKRDFMIWHIQAGILVFILVWPRLLWRAANPAPPIRPPLKGLHRFSANLAHHALYFMMAALPIFGFLALESKGRAVHFFGLQLPVLIDEDKWLHYALTLRHDHALLGNILIGMIALHLISAVLHHVLRQDDTLKRMLPWLK
ncbi:MAG TPA: cytochrome b [Burkholderiales bacterium]|nr:cytochrome b [Burkholderiales bacterium]